MTILLVLTYSALFLVAGCALVGALLTWASHRSLSAMLLGVALGCLGTAVGGLASTRADEMAGIVPAVLAGLAFWLIAVPSALAALLVWRAGHGA